MCVCVCGNLSDCCRERPEGFFSIGHYSFSWIAPFTFDPYLITLCVKPGGIKYNGMT